MLIVYFYWLSLFVSVVYKSSASHSHWLLVIGVANEVWMLVSFPSDCELEGNVVFRIIKKWITSDRTSLKVIKSIRRLFFGHFYPNLKLPSLSLLALELTLLSWNLCSHNLSFLSKGVGYLSYFYSVIRRSTGFLLGY